MRGNGRRWAVAGCPRGLVGALLLTALSVAAPASAQFDFLDSAPEKTAWQQFPLDPKVRVTLDFRNASADAVLRMLSQASGITIVKDPGLTGGLTLQSPRPQSLDSAFALLNAVLNLKNFELQKQNDFLIVRPKQQRPAFGGRGFSGMGEGNPFGGGGTSSQLKVYPIKYANAAQVARVINEVFATPLTPPDTAAQTQAPGAAPGQPFAGGDGGNTPFSFGRRGGQGGGIAGRFAALAGRLGGGSASVKASADDYSNSVIVNASSRDQVQVASLISQLDKETTQPQQSRVFPLKFATAAELAPVVQNVLVSNAPRGRGGAGVQNVPIEQRFQQAFRFGNTQAAFGQVVADARTNSLVVTATQDNLVLLEKVIQELDREVEFVSSTFVVTLSNARADQVAQLLNQSFGGVRNAGGTLTGVTTRIAGTGTNRRNNAAGGNNRPATLGGNRSATGATRAQETPGQTRAAELEFPQNEALELELAEPGATAGELATSVSVRQTGVGGVGGGRRFQGQPTGQRSTGTNASGQIVNVRDLTGDVTAIPDINTNSVILVTSPQNREIIEQILQQLDKIPEQVMIETLIVEASLDASSKFGVEWGLTQDKVFGSPNIRANTTQAFGLRADETQPQGLRYTLTGTQYNAFVQALKTDSRFEVLSTPRIFTSNNATAEINISQSLPYVVSQQVLPNGNIAFNYAFLDVGIILTVTPRITSNGYVTMDVTQTANDFVRYTEFDAPIVNQREADTTVSVKDGETVVLGGVIRSSVSATVNKIPLLGDIPVLGNLFKSNTTTRNKTELLVFLTPRIVRDNVEAQRLRSDTEKQLQSKTINRMRDSRKDEAPPVQRETGEEQKPATPQPGVVEPANRPQTRG